MKISRARMLTLASILSLACCLAPRPTLAETCDNVVRQLNRELTPKIDERELVGVLRALNRTSRLPAAFLTKREAR